MLKEILGNVGFVIKKDYTVIKRFCDIYVAYFARHKLLNMTTLSALSIIVKVFMVMLRSILCSFKKERTRVISLCDVIMHRLPVYILYRNGKTRYNICHVSLR